MSAKPRTREPADTAPIDAPSPARLQVRDLGRMPYADALALQRELQREVIAQRGEAGRASDTTPTPKPRDRHPRALGHLLLVEHVPPVITVSRRATARQHLIATPDMLAEAGVEVAETDRGGDITYHGPGQLVVYPILDLNMLGLRLHGYMRMLEQIVIDVLARWEIVGERDATATGVWVRPNATTGAPSPCHGDPPPLSKICAMGVRVSRWVSMHGLALNVTTNLDHFRLIVPCGLAGRPVTSMEQALGDRCPSMDEVKRAMVSSFERAAAARHAASSSPAPKSKLMQ